MVLSAIADFKKTMTGKAAAAALVAVPLTFGAAAVANDAFAQDNQVATTPDLPRTIEPSIGNFGTTDLRSRDVDGKFMEAAPGAASTGRISVILYGNSERIKDAAGSAAYTFSQGIHDASFIWAQDNDSNAKEVRVVVYGNGRQFGYLDIGVNADQAAVAKAVYDMMKDAYGELIEPRLAQAPGIQPVSQ